MIFSISKFYCSSLSINSGDKYFHKRSFTSSASPSSSESLDQSSPHLTSLCFLCFPFPPCLCNSVVCVLLAFGFGFFLCHLDAHSHPTQVPDPAPDPVSFVRTLSPRPWCFYFYFSLWSSSKSFVFVFVFYFLFNILFYSF